MEEATNALVGHLRQNDIGVRYDRMTLALVLPDTKGKDGYFVIEKLRKITNGILLPNGQTLPMSAGIAEAVLQNTDPIDSVTDLINRLEFAMEAAEDEGPGTAKLL
jgi:GGDEF domain-containing protein